MSSSVVQRRPGRPRQSGIEQRVLDAVVELIDEEAAVTVTAVVDRSGVSRAAVYRRWDTMAKLVAAALDRGRSPITVPEGASLDELLMFGIPRGVEDPLSGYPESRMRQRVRLGLGDRALQREYWASHVSRRRVPVTAAFERAREAGEVREDVDIDALQDLVAGLYYYQFVVRGASLTDPDTLARCRAALDIVGAGIRSH